jgi:glutathione synthase/RimK-type ligase-like ATP-grasp enzyme
MGLVSEDLASVTSAVDPTLALKQAEARLATYRQAVTAGLDSAAPLAELAAVLSALHGALGHDGNNVAIAEGCVRLGDGLRDCERFEEAIAMYRCVLEVRPRDSRIHLALGNVLLRCDRVDEAEQAFRRAHSLRPPEKRPGIKPEPDFSVLLINTPGIANTPVDYLVAGAAYDSCVFTLMAGADYDLETLRGAANVVVNLISDVDVSRRILPQAERLCDALGLPVINHPRKIATTGREAVASRLTAIPDCRIPKIGRIAGTTARELDASLEGFGFPAVVRVSGNHGGSEFEKIASAGALAAFIRRKPEADYYVSEYVPYESGDGYFRKYRMIFVDGEIYPYHLAISTQWKVHHFSTDMGNQEWMRKEEQAFVTEPATVFAPTHWRALQMVQERIGLDYFGIDCALDHDGNLLVFEVNAAMLVHGESGTFVYKEPYIARIKQAFGAMLARAAGGRREQ